MNPRGHLFILFRVRLFAEDRHSCQQKELALENKEDPNIVGIGYH